MKLTRALQHYFVQVSEWSSYNCSSSGLTYDECELSKKDASIPFNYTTDDEMTYAQCLKYNVSRVDFIPGMNPSNYTTEMLSTLPCDEGWVYDDSQYKSTVVTDVSIASVAFNFHFATTFQINLNRIYIQILS